ncbi:MAG TPA: prepilin-type N-terminal cleavage/methylation domain-containing protein [Bacilli bacterium]|nr:prepilin-type N-terminal cleavage/methylation domain-containing protein [Bacilli bacterium]
MRIRLGERGLTLLELMAAVVILTLVALPVMRLGTTALAVHVESQTRNEGVLLAEDILDQAKGFVERDGAVSQEQIEVVTDLTYSLTTTPFAETDGVEIPDLVQVTVTVQMPGSPEPVMLETVVRRREAP